MDTAGRLNLYDADLRFIRTITPHLPASSDGMVRLQPGPLMADGSILEIPYSFLGTASAPILLATAAGELSRVLTHVRLPVPSITCRITGHHSSSSCIVAHISYIVWTNSYAGDSRLGKTATARARIEPEVKDEAERILEECGLSASEAIGLFYRQVILHQGVPFPIQNFNEETRTALRKGEQGLEVARFDSAEALFEDLGI